MKKLGLLLVLGFSFSVHAETMAGLQQQMANRPPFEVLKNLFENSANPVATSYVSAVGRNCAYAAEGSSLPSVGKVIVFNSSKMVKEGVPAQPEKGPLFPAQPEVPPQYETKEGGVVIHSGEGSQSVFDSYFDDIVIDNQPTQLATGFKSFKWQILVRKNNGLISFQIGNNGNLIYGYCWP